MKNVYSMLMSALMVILMPHAYAGNTTVEGPAAHDQKHAVPEGNASGNYLEHQDQGTTEGSRSESLKDGAVPINAKEKSQRFKKEPEQGGTDVNQPKKH